MLSPTLSECHVKISNVIIHFAANFLLFDLPDQIRSVAGRAFCTVDLFVSLFGENSIMVHLVMSVLIYFRAVF